MISSVSVGGESFFEATSTRAKRLCDKRLINFLASRYPTVLENGVPICERITESILNDYMGHISIWQEGERYVKEIRAYRPSQIEQGGGKCSQRTGERYL